MRSTEYNCNIMLNTAYMICQRKVPHCLYLSVFWKATIWMCYQW